ncbi:MAG: cytochrome c oxidase subunit II [Actinomycetota bacterium]|jgi:cytochrome c oxidase subunit 2|nr:cytochrome c oxidase subunit II [Actinomycetota bacterium]
MTQNTPRPRRWRGPAVVVAATLLLAACSAENNRQNSLKPKGPAADKINNLFTPVLLVAVIVGVLVLGAVVLFALRYRYRAGKNENPKQIHGSTPLEIGWTIVPALILAVVAVPTIATIFDLHKEPSGDVLNVTAIGKQWWWEFEYPNQKVVTANELMIPAGRTVRVNLTACDESLPNKCNVIHSFWVPELNGKQDVIPGRKQFTTIEADKPGTYLGQCAEYCGLSHANMRFRVIAVEKGEFDRWIRAQQQGPAVPLQTGTGADAQPAGAAQEMIATKYQCTNCHSVADSKVSSYGPNLTHLASRTTFASGYYKLTRDQLVNWVYNAPGLVPMESEHCRDPGEPAAGQCVGMPSFSRNTPAGQPTMTRPEAEQIADYLLQLK